MSRTYKKYVPDPLAKPRGQRQAKIAGCRKKAIPRSAWDDKRLDKQCYIPEKVAQGMADNEEPCEVIISHLMSKFGLRLHDARKISVRAVQQQHEQEKEKI